MSVSASAIAWISRGMCSGLAAHSAVESTPGECVHEGSVELQRCRSAVVITCGSLVTLASALQQEEAV